MGKFLAESGMPAIRNIPLRLMTKKCCVRLDAYGKNAMDGVKLAKGWIEG
jgi:hypothetical protein